MKIFPAIDLRGGRCVRLRQGRAEDETVYSDDPVRMALSWQDQGAEFLHVVDLDGAFAGRPVHTALFRELAAALRIPFEVGGGLRTDDDVRAVLEAGAARAILGSRAVSDPDCVARLAGAFGRDRIVAGNNPVRIARMIKAGASRNPFHTDPSVDKCQVRLPDPCDIDKALFDRVQSVNLAPVQHGQQSETVFDAAGHTDGVMILQHTE